MLHGGKLFQNPMLAIRHGVLKKLTTMMLVSKYSSLD
jgi:hypothetical protein